MCLALLVDAQGDAEMLAAQAAIARSWTTGFRRSSPRRSRTATSTRFLHAASGQAAAWTHAGDHEGYIAGYFIEAALAHYLLTGGKDRRMYDAAKKLADCWDANIGPAPKKAWYDGHEEMEQALVRLARFVERSRGRRQGRQVRPSSRSSCSIAGATARSTTRATCRSSQQYEAVGHAVRAVVLLLRAWPTSRWRPATPTTTAR